MNAGPLTDGARRSRRGWRHGPGRLAVVDVAGKLPHDQATVAVDRAMGG